MSDPVWRVFDTEDLLEKLEASGAPYLEFLRVSPRSPAASTACGPAQQDPHDEDEVPGTGR